MMESDPLSPPEWRELLLYLQQPAEGSTDVRLGSLMALTLRLVDSLHKLLQNLHSEDNTKTSGWAVLALSLEELE